MAPKNSKCCVYHRPLSLQHHSPIKPMKKNSDNMRCTVQSLPTGSRVPTFIPRSCNNICKLDRWRTSLLIKQNIVSFHQLQLFAELPGDRDLQFRISADISNKWRATESGSAVLVREARTRSALRQAFLGGSVVAEHGHQPASVGAMCIC